MLRDNQGSGGLEQALPGRVELGGTEHDPGLILSMDLGWHRMCSRLKQEQLVPEGPPSLCGGC